MVRGREGEREREGRDAGLSRGASGISEGGDSWGGRSVVMDTFPANP